MGEYLPLKLPDEHFAFSDRSNYSIDFPTLITQEDIHLIVDHKLKAVKAKAWKSAIRRSRRKH